MGLFSSLKKTKDISCAICLDVLSMGGFWVVNGQTKTGEVLDALAEEEEWKDFVELSRKAAEQQKLKQQQVEK